MNLGGVELFNCLLNSLRICFNDITKLFVDNINFLTRYIENRKGPMEIVAMGHDEKLVTRILKLVNRSEFKRYQTAPVLRVSNKAFGVGRRMPIVGKYLS